MPLTTEQTVAMAESLDRAERDRKQIRAFSIDYPDMTIDDGYAVQRRWVETKIARGNRMVGHKIGLTSRAMQRAAHIEEPDYGVLLADMVFRDGATIPIDRFIEPRIEVELAFILKEALSGPECSMLDVLDATAHIVPALEIIDARIHRMDPEANVPRKVFDTISDNAANAGIILGGRPVKPDAMDLRWVSALLYRNAVIEVSGVAAAVLNHPANGVAWLANRLHTRGVSLLPGQVILAGSFTEPVPVRPGDTFHVDYGPLGAVACHFA